MPSEYLGIFPRLWVYSQTRENQWSVLISLPRLIWKAGYCRIRCHRSNLPVLYWPPNVIDPICLCLTDHRMPKIQFACPVLTTKWHKSNLPLLYWLPNVIDPICLSCTDHQMSKIQFACPIPTIKCHRSNLPPPYCYLVICSEPWHTSHLVKFPACTKPFTSKVQCSPPVFVISHFCDMFYVPFIMQYFLCTHVSYYAVCSTRTVCTMFS